MCCCRPAGYPGGSRKRKGTAQALVPRAARPPRRRGDSEGDARGLLEPGGVYVQLRSFTFLREPIRRSPQVKHGDGREEPE